MKVQSLILISTIVLFSACGGSPKNSYAVKVQDYGQCRSLEEGEKIFYKKRLVKYICEDKHVLMGKPFEKKDDWYFKAGLYDGEKVEKVKDAKVIRTYHKRCQLQGAYGTGTQKIRKFYLNTKNKTCMPFEWSGEAGIVPFNTKEDCRFECFELR